MRILLTRFPMESAFGGAEVQTLSLVDGLRAHGHSVTFLGSCPVLLSELRRRQVPCVELDIGPPPVSKSSVVSFAWRHRRMAAKLRAACSEFESLDAVLMLSLSEKLLVTSWLARKRGAKVLWIEHDRVGPWLRKNPWLPALLRQSRQAVTVCVSELSRRLYVEMGWKPARVVTVANGIDPKRFAAPARGERAGGPLRIGCVSRLSPEKGVDVLVDAVTRLPDVTLEITGTGPMERAIQDRITHLGIGNRAGISAKPADLGAFYGALDVLVLPSREHDPFGLVAAEAMALGVPVVVTDACGIAEELRDGTDACIAKADDAEALATAIVRLRDPAERARIGEGGRVTATTRLTADAMVARYETLLDGRKKGE